MKAMEKYVKPVKIIVTSDDDQTKGRRDRQIVATLIVSLGMGMFGYVAGWISPTVQLFLSAESPVPMTTTQVSWVMGASSMGAVCGSLLSTLLMSRLGRRGTLLLFNAIPLLAWTITYSATTFPLLLTARVLAGTWIGTCFTIVPIYISEIVDPEYRSFLITLPGFMQKCGVLAVFTVGTYTSYWTLSLVGLAYVLFYWVILLIVPESPYYYLIMNKKEHAFISLSWLQKSDNVDEQVNKLSQFINSEMENEVSIFGLLKNPAHLKSVMKVALATSLTVASGGTLIVILPIVIPESSIHNLSNEECSIIGSIISLLFSFRPTCLALGSNKLSLIISGAVCGICMATMAVWSYFENKSCYVKHDLHWLPLVCYFIHIVFYSLYMYPTIMGLKGEMFPTKFKTSLSAFVTVVATLTISIILQAFIPIKTYLGNYVNFCIGCVCSFSLALLTYFCLMETEGKSLQDIQNDLNSPSGVNLDTGQNKLFH